MTVGGGPPPGFPQSSQIIDQSFYVDDFLIGASTVQEAMEIQEELNALLDKG